MLSVSSPAFDSELSTCYNPGNWKEIIMPTPEKRPYTSEQGYSPYPNYPYFYKDQTNLKLFIEEQGPQLPLPYLGLGSDLFQLNPQPETKFNFDSLMRQMRRRNEKRAAFVKETLQQQEEFLAHFDTNGILYNLSNYSGQGFTPGNTLRI
jgi:hypothetical protein